jgi:hypothetical protein
MRERVSDRRLWLCLLGGVLCLLAAAFAIEAKLAWYSPASSPVAEISASKLHPADAPKLIAQALSAPPVERHFPAEPIFLLTVVLLATLVQPFPGGPVRDWLNLQISPSFSPHLFRRPPPQS